MRLWDSCSAKNKKQSAATNVIAFTFVLKLFLPTAHTKKQGRPGLAAGAVMATTDRTEMAAGRQGAGRPEYTRADGLDRPWAGSGGDLLEGGRHSARLVSGGAMSRGSGGDESGGRQLQGAERRSC